MTPTNLRAASADDLNFVVDLQRRFSGAVGFLPTQALETYIAHDRVMLATENGEPCGYILGRAKMKYDEKICPITQAAVAMDAQRRHHGLALVHARAELARLAGQVIIQAWCADDIDAREFWPAAGFRAVMQANPGNVRGRSLTLWRRLLVEPSAVYEQMMLIPPPRSGYKARTLVAAVASPKPS